MTHRLFSDSGAYASSPGLSTAIFFSSRADCAFDTRPSFPLMLVWRQAVLSAAAVERSVTALPSFAWRRRRSRDVRGREMCKSCKRKLKAHVAAILLAPAVTAGQPILGKIGETALSLASPTDLAATATGELVPAAHAAEAKSEGAQKWTCPMHPHYIADEFGACPICGMDLVKLESGDDAPGGAEAASREVITVAPEVMQSMGVRLAKAEQTQFGRTIRSYGRVTENERLQSEISSRVEGWVTKLKTTAVGDEVSEGDLLFEMYAPQLVVSQNDYLRPGSADLRGRGIAQLKSLGVQDKAIEAMQGRKKPMQDVPFYAARSGVISELNIREGSHVQRGTLMARIQDYSSVWLMVGVAEKDLGFISRDTPATVTFPSLPDHEVNARVDYIYPTVDEKTRTGRVRLVVENPDGRIRPGSYADVKFEVGAEMRVAVPSEAVLRSGDGSHVVVSLGDGRFEPRAVETGLNSGRWTEVASGVEPGEQIVVSGQFLLDSGSALRESFRKLERAQLPLSLLKLDNNEMSMVDHLVDGALYLHEALVDGYSVQADFLDPAVSIRDLMWPRYKDTQLAFVLEDATAALKKAQEARAVSETQAALAELVAALRPWLLNGAPEHYRERGIAMFREEDGERLWLQMDGDAINPYSRGPGEQVPWPEASVRTAAGGGRDAGQEQNILVHQH